MTSIRSPRSSAAPLGRCLRGLSCLLVAVPAVLGCSGEIIVLSADGAGGGGAAEGGAAGGADGGCVPGGASAQPGPAPLALTDVKTAVFVGDALHLEAALDGTARYVVLSIDDAGVARAESTPDELLGPAELAEVSPGVHARVRASADGALTLDVVDTADPLSPELVTSAPLPGTLEAHPVFNAAAGRLDYCARPSPGEKAQLFSVDLSDPAAPSAPEPVDTFLCYWYEGHSYRSSGTTTIAWDAPTGNFVQSVWMWSFGPGGPATIVDLGYNQTGVHMYGNVLTAATSRDRAVFDPENASLFLLANPDGDPYSTDDPPFAWATLKVGAERRLLGVAGATVYLTTDTSIRAYDITDLLSPKLLEGEAWLTPSTPPYRPLASSSKYLAVADATGALFLLPRTLSGPVAPLVVHAADYLPPAADPACPD